MKRALSPSTNPAGLMSAAGALYAAVVMILNAVHHTGVIDPKVIVAAVGASAALYARLKVTPVADPRDGNGKPLAPAQPQPSMSAQRELGRRGAGRERIVPPSSKLTDPPEPEQGP